jgi:hypothetical protein
MRLLRFVRNVGMSLVLALSLVQSVDAANVGIYGTNSDADVASLLTTAGHSVTQFGGTAPTPGQLAGLDVLIMLRVSGNADITNFVNAGGFLITEWDAADWAIDTANMLDADVAGGGFVGTGTPVSFTAAGAALAAGVANPYSDSERTEFFRNFTNIGAGVTVLATRPGPEPAILFGNFGSGSVLVIGYDWADSFGSADADQQQLIRNAVIFAGAGTRAPALVPTLSDWALVMTGLLLAGAAMATIRRRRY